MPEQATEVQLSDIVESIGDGIHVIDTGFVRPRFDAAYLIVENRRAAFIDAGTNYSVPRLRPRSTSSASRRSTSISRSRPTPISTTPAVSAC